MHQIEKQTGATKMKALIIKTLLVLVTLFLTVTMIGSVVMAVFVSPLLAVACFAGSLAAVVGICELSEVCETWGE